MTGFLFIHLKFIFLLGIGYWELEIKEYHIA